MSQGLQFDVKETVLSNSSFGPQEIQAIVDAISDDFSNYGNLRDAVADLEARQDGIPATTVRIGVCLYLLGRYNRAIETLQSADGGALSHFYMGKAYYALEQYDNAGQSFAAAKGAGYDSDSCMLATAEAVRCSNDPTQALAILDGLSGAVEQSAEYLYQRGATVLKLGGNPSEVTALFERAVDMEPNHAGALFGLALDNDRHGNDEMAIDLYQRSTGRFPAHGGALLNLGLLYEDAGRYDRAVHCYERILDVHPGHHRARLFLKDAQASGDMFYDEEEKRRRERDGQLMSVPVTDFELSVRSRNCLERMGVMTLGDLARTSESELLASKNFGETSLVEMREMMTSKGLRLGMLAHEKHDVEPIAPTESLSDDDRAMHERPLTDLNLSVRARKCMTRLGITTIGELVRRTGDELLECKNFGVTSLNEVREKLGPIGIKLRGD